MYRCCRAPPIGLGRVTSDEPLPTLRDPAVDRALALEEFTTSPLYRDLLVGAGGDVTAVQVNLERQAAADDLLRERERLRRAEEAGELDAAGEQRLAEVAAEVKKNTARQLARQSALVEAVRAVVDGYRDHAGIFVGGVPMIAADMVSFVRSDLVLFGSAILGGHGAGAGGDFPPRQMGGDSPGELLPRVAYTLGILGYTDWRMTVISSNVVTVLLIIGLAIAIHLVVRYRELHRLAPEGPLYDRVRDAMRLDGRALYLYGRHDHGGLRVAGGFRYPAGHRLRLDDDAGYRHCPARLLYLRACHDAVLARGSRSADP
jgi:hypothetical protein